MSEKSAQINETEYVVKHVMTKKERFNQIVNFMTPGLNFEVCL